MHIVLHPRSVVSIGSCRSIEHTKRCPLAPVKYVHRKATALRSTSTSEVKSYQDPVPVGSSEETDALEVEADDFDHEDEALELSSEQYIEGSDLDEDAEDEDKDDLELDDDLRAELEAEESAVWEELASAAAEAEARAGPVDIQPSVSVREDDLARSESNAGGYTGRELATVLAKVAWETKAPEITLLHVAPLVSWTSYMLLCTVLNRTQLGAVAGKMEKDARERYGILPNANPGRSAWEVLDYGDVVVHIMSKEQRDHYDLDSFYGAAEEVELSFDEPAEISWTKRGNE